MQRRYIFAALLGNALESYDFLLFGFFAPIFSSQFFPDDTPFTSLIKTFAIFAIGFLSRPLGACFFGQLGDRYGRKKGMLLSMQLMAVSTCLIGLLPSYNIIGVWAPLLLVLLRLCQGISLGGEYTGAMTFIFEHAPPGKKNYYMSWIFVGSTFGLACGATIGALMTIYIPHDQMQIWGWRIPFIFGFFIAFLSYYIRQKTAETPTFLHLNKTNTIEHQPIKKVLLNYPASIAQVIGLILPGTIWLYVLYIYLPAYLIQKMNWEFYLSFIVSLIPLLFSCILLPFSGYLADNYDKKKIYFISLSILTLIAPFCLLGIMTGNIALVIILELICAFFGILTTIPLATLLAEAFPAPIRTTGMAISYNVATGVFGGMTPFLLTSLTTLIGGTISTILWVLFAGIVGMISINMRKKSLQVAQ